MLFRSAYGQDMKAVILSYFRQVNESGGVFGRKLELLSEDDGYETEKAVANTRRLISEKKVFAMIASYGSSPTTAAMNEVFGIARSLGRHHFRCRFPASDPPRKSQ